VSSARSGDGIVVEQGIVDIEQKDDVCGLCVHAARILDERP
jgi:hypothetical protein